MHNIATIFRKEVASFFNSLIAYIVIAAFLTGVGLFFWLFQYNILESGYASMQSLFDYGPYMFLFLVPAITMRAFSEEIKTGTIELLLTRPVTDAEIIWGKFLASAFLVLFSILPTIIYVISVSWLGDPVANLDYGATLGSYIGLFFLGCIFAALGIFSSSLTSNQIIAFILSVFLCFILFIGFDFLAEVPMASSFASIIAGIGIWDHYQSISRGVIDTRDIFYFLSVIAIFILATQLVLHYKRN